MSQINQRINNIVELTSWLSEKDIKKLPAADRKIAILAKEMQNKEQADLPKALKDETKLALVESHLEQIHRKNPFLKELGIINERPYSKEEILKEKSNTRSAKISRTVKNVFGRISSKDLVDIYHKDDPNKMKIGAASGNLDDFRKLALVERDPVKKFNLLKTAAENDHKSGYFHNALADCYMKGEGVAQNKEKALEHYKKAANLGQQEAQVALGNHYEKNEEFPLALNYYELACEHERSDPDFSIEGKISEWYREGRNGIPQNEEKAKTWFIRAEAHKEGGDINAKYEWAMILKTDSSNQKEAFRFLSDAASKNHPKAQYELGNAYLEGKGIEQDLPEAFRSYIDAIHSARRELGQESNWELPTFGITNLKKTKKDASEGDVMAMLTLANYYQDTERLKYYKMAAERYIQLLDLK